jgi:hypothetical protein
MERFRGRKARDTVWLTCRQVGERSEGQTWKAGKHGSEEV